MKKAALIVATVLILALVVHRIDQITRAKVSRGAKARGSVDISQAAPDVTFKDLTGGTVPLAQYRGKVVLVNFWATWCDPCRREIPWLIEMQQKYASRGFTVLGVAMDEEGKSVVELYLQKERFTVNGKPDQAITYPIVLGDDEIADKFGGLIGYPTSVLISPDGRQVRRIDGLISYDEMARAIESLLR